MNLAVVVTQDATTIGLRSDSVLAVRTDVLFIHYIDTLLHAIGVPDMVIGIWVVLVADRVGYTNTIGRTGAYCHDRRMESTGVSNPILNWFVFESHSDTLCVIVALLARCVCR